MSDLNHNALEANLMQGSVQWSTFQGTYKAFRLAALYTNASTRTSDTYAIAIKGFPDAVVYFSSITPLTGIALELSNRGDVY